MSEVKSLFLWSAVGTAIGAAAGVGFAYYSQQSRVRKTQAEKVKEEVQKKKAAGGVGKNRAKQPGKRDEKERDEQHPRPKWIVAASSEDEAEFPEKKQEKENEQLDAALNTVDQLKSPMERNRDALNALENKLPKSNLPNPNREPSNYKTKSADLSQSAFLYLVDSTEDIYITSNGSSETADVGSVGKQSSEEKVPSVYPFSPDEGANLTEEVEELTMFLQEIDKMHTGTDATRKEAFEILLEYYAKFDTRYNKQSCTRTTN
ncbi:regulator of microtubule dynamics protein 3-like [Pleurodeles waltl]|uniref:regulator of microtubule dynamics protein 3-like n=1 Tax=Pleurodeles waltl TaxID=8319 RepID=UPI00370970EA